MPGPGDPVGLINADPIPVELTGRLLTDARKVARTCSALVDVDRIDGVRHSGRSELLLRPCPQPPLQGWHLRIKGRLQRPSPGPHPRLPGSAERLARQACWSQLKADGLTILRRPWTPVADLRRTIARRLQAAAGPKQGGLIAALVLGGAQVSLPFELRHAFRVAGLSHALAASGFHLSVLLGAALWLGRRTKPRLRVGFAALALVLFPTLAGAQPSVIRAVLMGAAVLLIRESGERSRAIGVLVVTLIVMLLIHPGWARAIGFQLSAAATAGLILTAPRLEAAFNRCLPQPIARLAPVLAVPCAAMLWTLPLQLLHFGSTPLYALPANLMAAPLLGPLTLAAMALALVSLVLPVPLLQLLVWPVQLLAGLLIAMVNWISSWPGGVLLTGELQHGVAALLALSLLPWALALGPSWRRFTPIPLLIAVLVQLNGRLSDGVVAAHSMGRHWLLARHSGRGALVSTRADRRSCAVAQRLAQAHGLGRLDWVLILDPVATEDQACWRSLALHVQASQQGMAPMALGQQLRSDGLSLELLSGRGMPMLLRVGGQRWAVLPTPQALWALRNEGLDPSSAHWTGTWLGFQPSTGGRHIGL